MVEKTNIPGHHLLVRYLHDSHQGSCTLEMDESGNVITYEEYHPFGTSSYQATNAGILSSSKRYRYVGKERDEESGLYYYGARFYAPWLCRFMSCDPKAAQFPDQSPYNYCFNNPINLIDPDGMEPEGPDDPPKNNEPATNGNAANKLGDAFTPTPGEPVDPKNVRAAGIDGGAGATNLQNLKPESVSKNSELSKDNITPNKAINFTEIQPREPDIIRGPNDPDFWMTQNNYNPEMANFVATKNAAENPTGIEKFSIWFKFGSDQLVQFEIGRKTTTQPPEFVNVKGVAFHSGKRTETKAWNEGYTTLGEHRAGQNLQNLIETKNIPWEGKGGAQDMWGRLSKTLAKSFPEGSTAPTFLNNPRPDAVWIKEELPVLQQNNVKIIYH